MVNRPKQIGTAGESAVVRYLRETRGFPEERASRKTLSGAYDVGDVHVEFPHGDVVVVEVKSGKMADAASLFDLAKWQEETAREVRHAGGERGMLVVKRRATSPKRVDLWRAFISIPGPLLDRDYWVEMTLAEAVDWLEDQYGRYPQEGPE